jgi:hypothetical protein
MSFSRLKAPPDRGLLRHGAHLTDRAGRDAPGHAADLGFDSVDHWAWS